MSVKHTPGPWFIEEPEAEGDTLDIYADANGRRSIIYRPTWPDARLIAAAPNLLAAVEAGVAYQRAIAGAAFDPARGLSEFQTVEGADLDALFETWFALSAAALKKAGIR